MGDPVGRLPCGLRRAFLLRNPIPERLTPSPLRSRLICSEKHTLPELAQTRGRGEVWRESLGSWWAPLDKKCPPVNVSHASRAPLSESPTNPFPGPLDSGVCRADVETKLRRAHLLLIGKGWGVLCASPFRHSSRCYFYQQ